MLTLLDKQHRHESRTYWPYGRWFGLYRCECGVEVVVDNGKANRGTNTCGCGRRRRIGDETRGKTGADHPSFGHRRVTDEAKRANHRVIKARYRAAHPDRIRAYLLKCATGLSVETYEAMLLAQHGVCAICATGERDNNKRLAVDHDHVTGQVRGLLCRRCNTGIGLLGDSADRVAAALRYLRASQERAA